MTAKDKELAAGLVIAGKFRLDRVIGRGGMGSVWSARQVQLDMHVALKFMDPLAVSPETRTRFEREAKAAAMLRSPHVVQVIDHGVDGDMPFIVMELLEGEDLGERLRRVGRISPHEMAKIMTQAAKALRRAHEAGVIHRDLKPGNVYLARFDEDEVVKLLDFGVAKMRMPDGTDQNTSMTQTGIVFGSPSYMSPEQARGARVLDHRTDLWSLAVIAYRSITGVKPFIGDSIGDLVIKLCIDPLPRASKALPELSPAIDAFFDRAFARDPDQRFQTAGEMAAAFAAAADGDAALDDGRQSETMIRVVTSDTPPPPVDPPRAEPFQPVAGTTPYLSLPLLVASGAYPAAPETGSHALPPLPPLASGGTGSFTATAIEPAYISPGGYLEVTSMTGTSAPYATPPAASAPPANVYAAPAINGERSHVNGEAYAAPSIAPSVDATLRNVTSSHVAAQPPKPKPLLVVAAAFVGALALFVAIGVGIARHRAAVAAAPPPAVLPVPPATPEPTSVPAAANTDPAVTTAAPEPSASSSATADVSATTEVSAAAPPSSADAPPIDSAAPSETPPADTTSPETPRPPGSGKPGLPARGPKKPHKPNFGY